MFNIIAFTEDNKIIKGAIGPAHNIIIYTITLRILLQRHLVTAAAANSEHHSKSTVYKYSTNRRINNHSLLRRSIGSRVLMATGFIYGNH